MLRLYSKEFKNVFVTLFLLVIIFILIMSPAREVISSRSFDSVRDFGKMHPESQNDHQTELAVKLKEVRVLCWILTSRTNRIQRAHHAATTWGKRCDKLLLMSGRDDEQIDNIVPLPVDEGRENLWIKTKLAFQYIYQHHRDDADWFVKADDDT